jgi:hypothetical protein
MSNEKAISTNIIYQANFCFFIYLFIFTNMVKDLQRIIGPSTRRMFGVQIPKDSNNCPKLLQNKK